MGQACTYPVVLGLLLLSCTQAPSAPRPPQKAKPAGAPGVQPRKKAASAAAAPVCEAGARGCHALGGQTSDPGVSAAAAAAFRAARRHLGGFGRFPRRLLEARGATSADGGSEGGGLALFLREPVQPGQVLIEVPLSRVYWRETLSLPSLGVDLSPESLLSEAERLILGLALLRRHAARGSRGGGSRHAAAMADFGAYGELLTLAPVPNSTVLWGADELAWLEGTDAGELTSHFLSRLAHVLSAAPLAVDLNELKAAFAQYHSRQFHLWLGGSNLFPDRVEVAMLPGIDLCRHREGGLAPQLNFARGVVQLTAAAPMRSGEEIFVDFGARDATDLMVAGSRTSVGGSAAGVFLPVPLDSDANGGAKARIIERLRWPAEVRLGQQEVGDLRVLRLAAMPREEFTSWSVGALVAGAPLQVSRAFRTEVQAHAYLVTECAKHLAKLSPVELPTNAAQGVSAERLAAVRRFRGGLAETYGRCEAKAREKLGKLRRWALKQHSWYGQYVEEALWRCDYSQSALRGSRDPATLPPEPPGHVDPRDLDQRLAYASVVALVNSKAREFVPYFSELLKAPEVGLKEFRGTLRRLQQIRRLATSIVQLKGPACGGVDLSAFDWLNELKGEEEAYSTLRYLLPEMDDLVREFLEIEEAGEVPAWR